MRYQEEIPMTRQKIEEHEYLELTYGKGRGAFVILIDLKDDTIWIDLKILPTSVFLCASYDGESMRIVKCGKKRTSERRFLNSHWVINEWGGPKELVSLIKKRIDHIRSDIPTFKEKHKHE